MGESGVRSHCLSTIQKGDRIQVLEKGEVIEQGTHTELIARNGRYAGLSRKSFSGNMEASNKE